MPRPELSHNGQKVTLLTATTMEKTHNSRRPGYLDRRLLR